MSVESVLPSNHPILCGPLLLLPSVLPSIRVFPNELALHIRWPKYRSFSFNISPSSDSSGLTSFGIDKFDLPTVQGTLRTAVQSGILGDGGAPAAPCSPSRREEECIFPHAETLVLCFDP